MQEHPILQYPQLIAAQDQLLQTLQSFERVLGYVRYGILVQPQEGAGCEVHEQPTGDLPNPITEQQEPFQTLHPFKIFGLQYGYWVLCHAQGFHGLGNVGWYSSDARLDAHVFPVFADALFALGAGAGPRVTVALS